jgi:hypothetical protein
MTLPTSLIIFSRIPATISTTSLSDNAAAGGGVSVESDIGAVYQTAQAVPSYHRDDARKIGAMSLVHVPFDSKLVI